MKNLSRGVSGTIDEKDEHEDNSDHDADIFDVWDFKDQDAGKGSCISYSTHYLLLINNVLCHSYYR